MFHFLKKKIRKNTCRFHHQNLNDMIYHSWDTEQKIFKSVILGHFLPFHPPKTPKNQNFDKWTNLLEISSFYTYVPKITIIWCTVPEIWSETDRICCHSGPLLALLPPYGYRKSTFWKNEKNTWWYYHFTNVYHKLQSYDVWFLRYGMQQTEIFVILDHFFALLPC